MASEQSKALNSLTLEELLTLYGQRFPEWAVPPVLNPSQENPESNPLKARLVLSLATNQPVVEWQQQYADPEVRH